MKKAAVFSCPGLGDGLISLQLAYNLSLNGYAAELFHSGCFYQLQKYTDIAIKKYPKTCDIEKLLTEYEKIFVSQDLNSAFVRKLIEKGKQKAENRVFVLNPAPSRKIKNRPFYTDTYFRSDISMVENIRLFVKNVLKLKNAVSCSPLILPNSRKPDKTGFQNKNKTKKNLKIVIHPTASRPGKSWKRNKFAALAKNLEKKGFSVFFVMTEKEKQAFATEYDKIKTFASLDSLASFLQDAVAVVGGDSGIGHLASALNIATLSIFKSCKTAALWKPGWGGNRVVAPFNWIPNISGFRLRDKRWADFISVKRVEKRLLCIIQAFYS